MFLHLFSMSLFRPRLQSVLHWFTHSNTWVRVVWCLFASDCVSSYQVFHCAAFGPTVEVCCVPAVGLFWPTFSQVWGGWFPQAERRAGAVRTTVRSQASPGPLFPSVDFKRSSVPASCQRGASFLSLFYRIALHLTQASQIHSFIGWHGRTKAVCEMCALNGDPFRRNFNTSLNSSL